MRVSVAWRGASGFACVVSRRVMSWAAGPLRRTMPRPPRPAGVATATIVSEVENTDRTLALLPQGDMDRFPERVADAFGRQPRNLSDRTVDDAALVRDERSELLTEAGLFDFFGEQLRHLSQLDVFALAVVQRIHKGSLLAGQGSAERHVDDVLQGFEGLSPVPNEDLCFIAADAHARTIRRLFHSCRRLDPQRGGESLDEIDDRLRGVFWHFSPRLCSRLRRA